MFLYTQDHVCITICLGNDQLKDDCHDQRDVSFTRDQGNFLKHLVWYSNKTAEFSDPDANIVASYNNINENNITNKNYKIVSVVGDEVELEFKGAYFNSDGGYNRWSCLVNPYHLQPPGTDLESWSSNVESVQKDIESLFEILKKRFLFLKILSVSTVLTAASSKSSSYGVCFTIF